MSNFGIVAACCLALAAYGCSVKRMAINKIGDALASGGSTFETDDDPDLVADALPFGLKITESLLAESPKHKGLLLMATRSFTEYSYAFVEQRADELTADDLQRGKAQRARARRLYLRALGYGLRGLEAAYPGFGAAFDDDPAAAMARLKRRDVPLLYWTAAAYGLALSSSKNQPRMIAQFPRVEAMGNRLVELDESWGKGAVQEFLLSLENARSDATPEARQQHMRQYFDRSLALSNGEHASLFVSFAENSSVPAQDRAGFRTQLEKALALDADARPENRLATLVAQRRARWLLSRIEQLFLPEVSSNQ
jgi:predicted anti-sigma-YlaC factor YlaD